MLFVNKFEFSDFEFDIATVIKPEEFLDLKDEENQIRRASSFLII